MRFTAATQIPLEALGPLAALKERYSCGPRIELDAAQRAMLEAVDELYPTQKLRIAHAALTAGRDYIIGADIFALAQKAAGTEEHAT